MLPNACGALTLGLSQTKDQIVQRWVRDDKIYLQNGTNRDLAAMRLRQLATSQSIAFFAPPEVHQSILHLRKKTRGHTIDSYDVICWILEQTCDGIEQLQPLYFSQGSDFCRHTQPASDNPDFLVDIEQRKAYLSTLRQKEQQTLEELYEPRIKSKLAVSENPMSSGLIQLMGELKIRRKAFQDAGNAVHGSALQEFEQEREVAFEVETVRKVQKPVHYSPLTFRGLHRDITAFVNTGRLVPNSAGYEQWFIALRCSNLGRKHGIRSEAATSRLFVSSEFTRTLRLPSAQQIDNFQVSHQP